MDKINLVFFQIRQLTFPPGAFVISLGSSIQFSHCHVWLSAIPWTIAHQASLSFTISWSLLKFIPLSWWCLPTILSSVIPFSSCLQSFPATRSFLMSCIVWPPLRIKWPKYWSFSFSISSSTEYSGLISFRRRYLIPELSLMWFCIPWSFSYSDHLLWICLKFS